LVLILQLSLNLITTLHGPTHIKNSIQRLACWTATATAVLEHRAIQIVVDKTMCNCRLPGADRVQSTCLINAAQKTDQVLWLIVATRGDDNCYQTFMRMLSFN